MKTLECISWSKLRDREALGLWIQSHPKRIPTNGPLVCAKAFSRSSHVPFVSFLYFYFLRNALDLQFLPVACHVSCKTSWVMGPNL